MVRSRGSRPRGLSRQLGLARSGEDHLEHRPARRDRAPCRDARRRSRETAKAVVLSTIAGRRGRERRAQEVLALAVLEAGDEDRQRGDAFRGQRRRERIDRRRRAALEHRRGRRRSARPAAPAGSAAIAVREVDRPFARPVAAAARQHLRPRPGRRAAPIRCAMKSSARPAFSAPALDQVAPQPPARRRRLGRERPRAPRPSGRRRTRRPAAGRRRGRARGAAPARRSSSRRRPSCGRRRASPPATVLSR